MTKKLFSFFTATAISLCAMCTTYSTGMKAAAKEPVEIVSKRTEYSKVFDNGDGTFTSLTNATPMHYFYDGNWIEIDNSLDYNENGYYTNKSSAIQVKFTEYASVNDEDIVSVAYGDYNLSWSMINDTVTEGNTSLVEVENGKGIDRANNLEVNNQELRNVVANQYSSAIYPSILKDIDIKFELSPSQLKETTIISLSSITSPLRKRPFFIIKNEK